MDLGTNTFHLLIAEGTGDGFNEIVHEEVAVKLGERGINKAFIQSAAFERGVETMHKFGDILTQNEVIQIKAIATSALRNAKNGQEFIDKVKSETGIAIDVISGDQEAEYIYKGVKACRCLSDQESLIIDVGGGSCEFIICNEDQIFWKQSFEIGAARLMDKFHQKDPIPPGSIKELNSFLEKSLKDLFVAAVKYPVRNIIGSSGVFECYASVIEFSKGNTFDLKKVKHYKFHPDELTRLMDKLVRSLHHERESTNGIIPVRVDMIVVASLLTRFIIEKLKIVTVVMSTNSLKEGVLAEMMG